MKAFFMANDLWEIIEDGVEPPKQNGKSTEEDSKRSKAETMKNMKAITFIHASVSESIFPRIVAATTAKEVWTILEKEFKSTEKARVIKLQTLRRDFENLNMKDDETVKDYSTRVAEVTNQMKLYGEDITDQRIVEKMLRSLPEKFDPIVAAIEESKDLSKLTIAELSSSLEAHEQRMDRRREGSIEGALQTRHTQKTFSNKGGNHQKSRSPTDKYPPCGTCRRTNHLEKDCWIKNKTQCTFCKKIGHIEPVCRFKKAQSQEANQHVSQQQHCKHIEYATDNDFSLTACHASEVQKQEWMVDSGCTNHMTHDEKLFSEINRNFKTSVKMGNGAVEEAKGIGTVTLQTTGGTMTIRDVLLVPDLKFNLLSVGQLIEHGFSLTFDKKLCEIYFPEGEQMLQVPMKNKSFSLGTANGHVGLQAQVDESKLWHRRFGHYNMESLNYLQKKNLIKDLPTLQKFQEVCEPCQLGKQHRDSFPSQSSWRAKKKLELIHTDVCGPMQDPSLNNNKYFILFIDDFTRMTWVYFMRHKSEVSSIFKRFKTMVENQSEEKIKVLRSDRGTEYTSNKFEKFCADAGIEQQTTVRYTPQQNGVSERKNRTVMEMARCMLAEKNLPKSFWAEAVNTAVYLLNRLPTRALKDQIPIEAWSGHKPTVKHLKVFGSMCYTHVPDQKRHKLEDKAERGIFVGYSSQSKGFRVYNIESQKVIITRDIKVDEDATWNWDESKVDGRQTVITHTEPDSEPVQPTNQNNSDSDGENSTESSESPPRKTRSLAEIYDCGIAAVEPHYHKEDFQYKEQNATMEEELKKNPTSFSTFEPYSESKDETSRRSVNK
ncbi:Retrovirus-related Pol polyprotein from transposon TNT 1-94 [Linum grandiflorum]